MRKKVLTVLLALTTVTGYAQVQKTPPEGVIPSKVAVFSFVVGNDAFMLRLNKNNQTMKEVIDFIDANREDIDNGSMPIFVYGYCGKGGTEQKRKERARRMSIYVKGELTRRKKAKESHFITSNSFNSYSDTLANVVVLKFWKDSITTPIYKQPEKEVVADEPTAQEVVTETPTIVSVQPEVADKPTEQEAIAEKATVIATLPKSDTIKSSTPQSSVSAWYVGGDIGLAFGRSTFASFAADKTRPGFSIGLLGGYRINHLLSAEVSIDYTHMTLGAYDCCQNLYLGEDGNRYLTPVAGMQGWNYRDIYSSTNLLGLGLHLNVDFMKLFRADSRWSALLSPAIYGTGSWAKVKTIVDKADAHNDGAFHFGIGTNIGVGYQVCDEINVRLYTGITYLTGNGMDGLQQADHTSNYIWNTGVKVTMGLDKFMSKIKPILTRNRHE